MLDVSSSTTFITDIHNFYMGARGLRRILNVLDLKRPIAGRYPTIVTWNLYAGDDMLLLICSIYD